MKDLFVTLSASLKLQLPNFEKNPTRIMVADTEEMEAKEKAILELEADLHYIGVAVNTRSMKEIRFDPESMMISDIDSLINSFEYQRVELPNVEFPTSIFADNKTDKEVFISKLHDGFLVIFSLNLTAGTARIIDVNGIEE